jgi:hypothetical protein
VEVGVLAQPVILLQVVPRVDLVEVVQQEVQEDQQMELVLQQVAQEMVRQVEVVVVPPSLVQQV